MPRISLRRCIFYFIMAGGIAMLIINVHQFRVGIGGGGDDDVQVASKVAAVAASSSRASGSGQSVPRKNTANDDRRHSSTIRRSGSSSSGSSSSSSSSVVDDLVIASRPWFMKGGQQRPDPAVINRITNRRQTPLFPHESDGDRIVEQLMYVPPWSALTVEGEGGNGTSPETGKEKRLKRILLFHGLSNWSPLVEGRDTFVQNRCPVDTCEVTSNREEAETADAIIFRDHVNVRRPLAELPRPPWQVWILYMLECPHHTELFPHKNYFNWTATYRHDSDIVAPYEKFVAYDDDDRPSASAMTRRRNYAGNKTKKVAWFVSNCAAHNSRMEFAEQLGRHIAVDIYGACGTLQCPRSSGRCFDLLNDQYKFYLSFENSNCVDYITEKFFVNGLGNDVLPIVMGARKEDYERAAPPHSFIYAEDFDTAEDLAKYLHLLDRNDTMYNEYFRWKGTGEFVNTYFWCRVCAMLHDDKHVVKVYEDINAWWRGPGTCTSQLWKDDGITTTTSSG